jgi:hypothetical protein
VPIYAHSQLTLHLFCLLHYSHIISHIQITLHVVVPHSTMQNLYCCNIRNCDTWCNPILHAVTFEHCVAWCWPSFLLWHSHIVSRCTNLPYLMWHSLNCVTWHLQYLSFLLWHPYIVSHGTYLYHRCATCTYLTRDLPILMLWSSIVSHST